MYNDKNLSCRDCGADFVFSASEQEFYASKGFENEPTRCATCRAARKQQNGRGGGRTDRGERQMFTTTCSSCGKSAEVPFRPSGDKPVYCRDCFQPRSRY
jgi:CxxC-x17-CxxC domain-containing protein